MLPARSSERIPSSLQSSCGGCQKGNTTFISSSVSSLLPSAQVLIFICLPALPLGPDGICRGPRFPFPQHKCSLYFLFPPQFLKSLRVLGHSSPCFCPELAPSRLCPDLPHQLGSLLLLKIHQFSCSVHRNIHPEIWLLSYPVVFSFC